MAMIRTGYVAPTSWDDKGMDWENPDPHNIDYWMAVKLALIERYATTTYRLYQRMSRINPWMPITRIAVDEAIWTLHDVLGMYVNTGYTEYKDDFSDFPMRWRLRDLVLEPDCEIFKYALKGEPVHESGEWLKSLRAAIDRITTIQIRNVLGKTLTRWGSRHDPPFDESIGEAISQAMSNMNTSRLRSANNLKPYGWSGNTHWLPPDEEGYRPYDGYCGFAESCAYEINAVDSRLLGASCDVFAAVICKAPTTPCTYAQVQDASVFDTERLRFTEGLNWTERVHAEDPHEFKFLVGDPDVIPRNEVVPVSEFDEDQRPIRRHSAKRGWVSSAYLFVDYACENGFRFRPKGT